MKKIVLFLAAALMVGTALTGCKDKKAPADTKPVETSMFTKEDTAKVMDLVNQFTMRLQNGDIQSAVDMLVYLNGDSIQPLDAPNMKRQVNALRFIAEAKIDVVLFEKKDENDKRPNTTSFYLRPILIDGQWYLTTRDNLTNTVDEDPIKNEVIDLGEKKINEE